MSDDYTPKVILTDRDLALMSAVGCVFPTTYIMLCKFHVEKNVYAKLKKLVRDDKQDALKEAWQGRW